MKTTLRASASSRRADARGLSLIEVMIALALLSVALIALIAKIHDCIDTARVTEYQNASREYAKELMGEIEAGTVDGLFDGFIGDFSDRGYPQLRYTIRMGESSTTDATTEEPRGLYEKPNAGTGTMAPLAGTPDPNADEANNDVEEPFTRVQIAVDFPTVNDESRGVFLYEKKLPTANTKGSRGLEEKRERDAEKAASDVPVEPTAGAGPGGKTGAGGLKGTGAGGGFKP